VTEPAISPTIAKATLTSVVPIGRYERDIGQMRIWSNSFKDGAMIPAKYTCDGENVSPHLAWDNVPRDTQSFALIMDDPDSSIRPFVHWIIINIDPRTREIPENSVPPDAHQILNSAQKQQYFGPNPQIGTHLYNFRLCALKDPSLVTDERNIFEDIKNIKISEAILTGRYVKPRIQSRTKPEIVTHPN
jgi:Raf kinase inhibitor-like YbhB/YbcL family protein